MLVRPAEERDLCAILEIETEAILNGVAHFAYEPTPYDEMLHRFQSAQGRYPWFVAEEDGQVIGYAKSGAYRAREAYDWSVEIGCYVRPGFQGRGIGKALYGALLPALEEAGFRAVFGGIAQPNEASVRLHESFGMVKCAHFPKVGWKKGQWHDVAYWAIHFGEGPPGKIGA